MDWSLGALWYILVLGRLPIPHSCVGVVVNNVVEPFSVAYSISDPI